MVKLHLNLVRAGSLFLRAAILGGGLSCWLATSALATVIVTPATGGAGIPADNSQNGVSNLFTTLGNIVIQEGTLGDFASQNNKTLILTAPAGWRFNVGAG